MLDYTNYIFRGHGDSNWKLEPTLDRIIKSPLSPKRAAHLEAFKLETRGRRGTNPPQLTEENDWWALGQHHGLKTPLLDWTHSPFVALYFAVSTAHKNKTRSFTVYAFQQDTLKINNAFINNNDDIELINDKKPTVKLIRPHSDENSRLVNQRGLFTRGPNNMDLEAWTKKFNQVPKGRIALLKIKAPTTGIQDCLRYLNRMNINHSTLFPDLTGASEYCNHHLSINKY